MLILLNLKKLIIKAFVVTSSNDRHGGCRLHIEISTPSPVAQLMLQALERGEASGVESKKSLE
jgi:hypothetical protein